MTLIERIENLKATYTDSCNMCTRCSCWDCPMTSIIDDLSELIQEVREENESL